MVIEVLCKYFFFFFFSSRRRHTRFDCDWSSDVCSSDLGAHAAVPDRGNEDPASPCRSGTAACAPAPCARSACGLRARCTASRTRGRRPSAHGDHRGSTVHMTASSSRQTRHSDLRSEEHTSELQSQSNLVCRLLLE